MGRKLLSDAAASKLARQQEEGMETPRALSAPENGEAAKELSPGRGG